MLYCCSVEMQLPSTRDTFSGSLPGRSVGRVTGADQDQGSRCYVLLTGTAAGTMRLVLLFLLAAPGHEWKMLPITARCSMLLLLMLLLVLLVVVQSALERMHRCRNCRLCTAGKKTDKMGVC